MCINPQLKHNFCEQDYNLMHHFLDDDSVSVSFNILSMPSNLTLNLKPDTSLTVEIYIDGISRKKTIETFSVVTPVKGQSLSAVIQTADLRAALRTVNTTHTYYLSECKDYIMVSRYRGL